MSTVAYVAKLIELTRYQTDIIEELITELLQYREIVEIEALDALRKAQAVKEELGE